MRHGGCGGEWGVLLGRVKVSVRQSKEEQIIRQSPSGPDNKEAGLCYVWLTSLVNNEKKYWALMITGISVAPPPSLPAYLQTIVLRHGSGCGQTYSATYLSILTVQV